MTEEEMLKNVRMMEGMFPAFIEHYKKVAFTGKVNTWAKAVHSVIDLVAQDSHCPHDFFPEECGLCHDAKEIKL